MEYTKEEIEQRSIKIKTFNILKIVIYILSACNVIFSVLSYISPNDLHRTLILISIAASYVVGFVYSQLEMSILRDYITKLENKLKESLKHLRYGTGY